MSGSKGRRRREEERRREERRGKEEEGGREEGEGGGGGKRGGGKEGGGQLFNCEQGIIARRAASRAGRHTIPYMEMAAKRSQVVQSGRYFRNLVACRDKGYAEHGFQEGYREGGLCPHPAAAFNSSKAFFSQ